MGSDLYFLNQDRLKHIGRNHVGIAEENARYAKKVGEMSDTIASQHKTIVALEEELAIARDNVEVLEQRLARIHDLSG